jgi:thioredoxin-related protein
MNKIMKILLMLIFVVSGIVIAVVFGTQKEVLPIGSSLPKLKYYSIKNSGYILPNGKPLIIMFFKPDCQHCEYELNTMNSRIDELQTGDYFCLTTDKEFIKHRLYEKWRALSKSKDFVFASINENDFNENIGIKIIPLFLIYNTNERLINKILGETKFDRLLQSIKKADGAQHQ